MTLRSIEEASLLVITVSQWPMSEILDTRSFRSESAVAATLSLAAGLGLLILSQVDLAVLPAYFHKCGQCCDTYRLHGIVQRD